MNGSSINYTQHMEQAHIALARCAFSKVAVALMDECAMQTLDALDDFEDEILDNGAPTPSRALEMRDSITSTYRAEMSTSARLSTLGAIAAIPTRLQRAEQAKRRPF